VTLRHRLGALVYDWPRFLRHIDGDWRRIHNRNETIVTDGRGVLCQWEYGSDLHIAAVFPSTSRWLLRRALADHPVSLSEERAAASPPQVSFVIGHRGRDRLPLLLTTLRSIAAQREAAIECIVVEQSARPEVQAEVPPWVRYLHTPVDSGLQYCRSAAFNAGAAIARGDVLILHDNDILVPESYAAEAAARAREGWRFMDLKRFIFYVSEDDTRALAAGGALANDLVTRVTQNLHGGSVVAIREAFFEIGGFDDEFVGWGGEDLDFWERAVARGSANGYGYLPLVHLWHPAQKGKAQPDSAAVRRYYEIRAIAPAERSRRLVVRQGGERRQTSE
jgi:GT2 family glycosyltransferase